MIIRRAFLPLDRVEKELALQSRRVCAHDKVRIRVDTRPPSSHLFNPFREIVKPVRLFGYDGSVKAQQCLETSYHRSAMLCYLVLRDGSSGR